MARMVSKPSDIPNYNVIFTHAVKAIQELSQLVKAQQVQIDELQKQLQNHLLMNSAAIISELTPNSPFMLNVVVVRLQVHAVILQSV